VLEHSEHLANKVPAFMEEIEGSDDLAVVKVGQNCLLLVRVISAVDTCNAGSGVEVIKWSWVVGSGMIK
jgi:hypothetical protein